MDPSNNQGYWPSKPQDDLAGEGEVLFMNTIRRKYSHHDAWYGSSTSFCPGLTRKHVSECIPKVSSTATCPIENDKMASAD